MGAVRFVTEDQAPGLGEEQASPDKEVPMALKCLQRHRLQAL
jgi:hypothetical protein